MKSGENLETATGKGLYWERYAQKILGGEVKSLQAMNGDVDLMLANGRTVDVKSCNLYKRKMKRGRPVDPDKMTGWWVFNRNAEKAIDFMFCVGLQDNRPVRQFLIPSNLFPKSGLTLSPKSDRFRAYELPV